MNNNSVNGLSQLKKPKRYTVVAFDVENTVVTIPTKWMVNSKNCSFPPYSKTRMDTAIQNCEDSEDSWTIYPCRILRTYDSLQLAIQATENLEQNYSPETEDGNQTPDFESYLPQASIHFSQLPATFRDSILQEPSPKRRKQNDEIAKDLHNSLPPSDVLLNVENSSSLSSVEGPSTPADVRNEDDVYSETKFILEPTDPSINTDSTGQSVDVLTGHIPNDDSYKALSMKLDKLLAQNAKILDEISSIKSVLASTMQLNCRFDAIDPTKTELPCQTPADLINFNAELKEEDVFACNLQKLRARGGSSESDIVRKALCVLMTNNLAKQYNWVAIRGMKEPFSVLKNITELLYAMTKYHVEDTTQDRVDSHIKKWLARACDRDGGRDARRKTTD